MQIKKYYFSEVNHTDVTAYLSEDYRVIGKKEKSPAVLICPGGGFFSLSEREGEPIALAFLKEGFQAFVLHYTLGNPTAGKVEMMEDALLDCARAVQVIRQHAEEFGIDAEKVIMLGFSAGAYLTAMYSSRYQERWLAERVNAADSLKIKAAVLCYPMCDLQVLGAYENSAICSQEAKEILQKASLCLCGEAEPSVEKRAKYSPVSYISENTPPTFIWHTDDDEIISVSNTLSYAARLSEKRVPYELHIFEHGVHGMSLALPHTAAKKEEENPHCAVWFAILMNWLRERIFL